MVELIQEVHFLRGAIISSYAEVEFLLTELNMRCRQLPAYAEIAAGFPYKLETKIARVRALIAAPGPLGAYADELQGLADRISDYEERRHFIAHGQLRVISCETTPKPLIILNMWRSGKKKAPEEYGEIPADVDQLTNFAAEIAQYAHQTVELFERICREVPLEPAPLEPDA